MPPELRCDVAQVGTRTIVSLHGDLCLATAPRVRLTLVKCLVDRPDAVIVDLDGLVNWEPALLSVLDTVARDAAVWPATPLLICAADPWLAAAMDRYRRLAVFGSVGDAMAARPARQRMSITDSLLPTSTSMRHARRLAAEACATWDFHDLTEPATAITNELVSNAVSHARTRLDLRLSRGRRYLLIAVRDGSTALPRLDQRAPLMPSTGRGLWTVEAFASRWGVAPAQGGKVVWASLRTG